MEEDLHPDYKQMVVTPESEAAGTIEALRHMFSDAAELIEGNVPANRQRAIALTHLETAAMFAIKAVTRG